VGRTVGTNASANSEITCTCRATYNDPSTVPHLFYLLYRLFKLTVLHLVQKIPALHVTRIVTAVFSAVFTKPHQDNHQYIIPRELPPFKMTYPYPAATAHLTFLQYNDKTFIRFLQLASFLCPSTTQSLFRSLPKRSLQLFRRTSDTFLKSAQVHSLGSACLYRPGHCGLQDVCETTPVSPLKQR
jgi:hypothetical protein